MADTLNELIDQCRESAALAGLATSEQRSWDRMADKLTALSAALAAQEALTIPDNWLPTSENINALPEPVRDYIMRLHANTDPAGELRRAMIAEMERDALRKMIEWQPIETAPKGVHVIVYNGYWVGQSYWGKVSHVPIYGWLDIYQGPENAELMEDQPTHWMPLPEAPSERS